ncbi:MAG TPA: toll/interleukin-1 receptor domain-containing protein [Cyclobacteriaceae bacterium]|nr:toll/interleukin-1 receptor domain-containing protein [Cyclobacteriaceae bacterium]
MPLQKRPNDLFISYGHADQHRINPIVDWLKRYVGLSVWYDAISGDASKRTTTLLGNAIQASRGAIFFLSSAWINSAWCGDEHEVALTERRADDNFLLLAVRLDNCEIPPWFKIANVLDFHEFQPQSCADLLRSLSPNPVSRFDSIQDVYLGAPWNRQTEIIKKTFQLISSMGWRLVGDSPNHPRFVDSTDRITSIISTSRGVVGLLSFDPSRPPTLTSPWIINELYIALHTKQPYIIFAESDVQIPSELEIGSFKGRAIRISDDNNLSSIKDILLEFDDELSHQPFNNTKTYSFLAASLLGNIKETNDLVSVIEHASNLTCFQGQGFSGLHVQQEIRNRIRQSLFVIADVTDDHRNSLIEAGVAMGAGVPLHLMSKVPENNSLKRRFMFEDIEMNWYQTPAERLAIAYKIASMYRRHVYYFR